MKKGRFAKCSRSQKPVLFFKGGISQRCRHFDLLVCTQHKQAFKKAREYLHGFPGMFGTLVRGVFILVRLVKIGNCLLQKWVNGTPETDPTGVRRVAVGETDRYFLYLCPNNSPQMFTGHLYQYLKDGSSAMCLNILVFGYYYSLLGIWMCLIELKVLPRK